MDTVSYDKTLRIMIRRGIFWIQQVFLFRNIAGAPVSQGVSQRYWFIYAVSGSGLAEVSERTHPLERGSLVTLCPGIRFCIRPKPGETLTYYAVGFMLRSEGAEPGETDGAAVGEIDVSALRGFTGCRRLSNTARVEAGLKELYRVSMSGVPGAAPEQKCAFYALLSTFLEASKAGVGNADIRRRIEKATEFIRDNYDKTIRVEDLAAQCGVSKEYFIRAFKEFMGTSPGQFVIALRIGKARELLPGQNRRVREVAALVGFKDEFYFSRLFKKTTGISPKHYAEKTIN